MPRGDIDLAIVGAGAAGTYLANRVLAARPDWTVVVYERSGRVGGRLRSGAVAGFARKIELGGMRFMSTHERVVTVIDQLGLRTHAFNAHGGGERQHLRGVVGRGPDDAASGVNYRLDDHERGRSAHELWSDAFEQIVPGYGHLDHESFTRIRATAQFLGRPLTDWSIGEALQALLSADAWNYVHDAFGYDSGIRAFNAPDLIEFLGSGGDPTAEARTPDDGMDVIPRALAERMVARGGLVKTHSELLSVAVDDGAARLEFADGATVRTARVVLTVPLPALELLAARSPVLRNDEFARVIAAVEAFPAMKLYAWYDRAWWRPGVDALRTVTNLRSRKAFYFDDVQSGSAMLLAMYTDGRDVDPWVSLAAGASDGAPAPPGMMAEVQRCLREMHPEVDVVPEPVGSALMHWGSDAHETGWHFWRPGIVSDEIVEIAAQPNEALPIFLAGEAFSRHQSWVEGALESTDGVFDRLMRTD